MILNLYKDDLRITDIHKNRAAIWPSYELFLYDNHFAVGGGGVYDNIISKDIYF